MKAILETIMNPIAKRRRDRYRRELTNGGLSHVDTVGSRHSLASPSCRNLNLRFLMKTTMLVGARQAIFLPPCLKFVFVSQVKAGSFKRKCLTSEK